ncbi:DUF1232 domain-containing protein [Promicromonospora sp. CA-289599]|uniref:DUF1232 domain-containing protein n=1 Tax=Promicromonospora sp. CA-289599 TaxID=3240014 RepID=UPI003D93B3C7
MGDEKKRGKDPRKFTWQEILTFIAGAGYVASPFDFMSEAFLGPLGLGDDAIAIIIAGATLFKAVQRFRQHRPKPGAPEGTASGAPKQSGTTPGAAPSGSATPGSYTTDKTIPGTAEDVTPGRRPKR